MKRRFSYGSDEDGFLSADDDSGDSTNNIGNSANRIARSASVSASLASSPSPISLPLSSPSSSSSGSGLGSDGDDDSDSQKEKNGEPLLKRRRLASSLPPKKWYSAIAAHIAAHDVAAFCPTSPLDLVEKVEPDPVAMITPVFTKKKTDDVPFPSPLPSSSPAPISGALPAESFSGPMLASEKVADSVLSSVTLETAKNTNVETDTSGEVSSFAETTTTTTTLTRTVSTETDNVLEKNTETGKEQGEEEDARVHQLRLKIEHLTDLLANRDEELHGIRQDRDALLAEIARLVGTMDSCRKSEEMAKRAADAKSREIENLEEELHHARRDLWNYHDDVEGLVCENRDLVHRLDSMEQSERQRTASSFYVLNDALTKSRISENETRERLRKLREENARLIRIIHENSQQQQQQQRQQNHQKQRRHDSPKKRERDPGRRHSYRIDR